MWAWLDRHWRFAAIAASGVAGGLGVVDAVLVHSTSWIGLHAVLGDGERDLLVAVAGALGTLTGISFAVTAMIISFSDKPSLDVYAKTDDYPQIAPMMRHSNMALAVSTVSSIISLACLDRPSEAVMLPLFLAITTYALVMLFVVMNRFSLMLDRVASSHQSSARERAKRSSQKLNATNPGELDDP